MFNQKKLIKVVFFAGFFILLSSLLLRVKINSSNSIAATNNVYYVSNSGNDSNSGLDISTPWASLSKVNSFNFSPGDVVNFERGSSWVGELTINDSGVDGSPIIFQAYGTGTAPTISNPGPQGSWTKDIVIGSSWVVVKDFLVTDAAETGVRILAGAEHNIVENIEATNVGFGVDVVGQYNLVTHNYAHDLHMVVNTRGGDDDYGAVGFAVLGPNNEVSYNRCINCKAESYDYGFDGGTVELYSNVDGSYIHHNYGRGTNGFIEVGGGSAQNIRVAYNVSEDNYADFACLHVGGTFGSVINNFQIDNNTIIQSVNQPGAYMIDCMYTPFTSTQLLFRNNVMYSANPVAADGAFTHENNIYYMVGGSPIGYTLNATEIQADPMFVDKSVGNFHLQPESPAIDIGTNLGYTLDFDNNPVPAGYGTDMGAYEDQSAPSITPTPTSLTPAPTATPTATPTPVPQTVTLYTIADAFVTKSNPTSNYGRNSKLKVDGKPIKLSYLKFDLSSLAGKTILSSTLNLSVSNSSTSIQNLYDVDDISWVETGITYNNKPPVGSLITTIPGGTINKWTSVDVTNYVQSKAGQIFSIAMDQSNIVEIWFYSRETGSKPTLTVQYY